jgi:CDP-glucose 4,6-dehydratase
MGDGPFAGGYQGLRVLVTGHTGFLGAWAVRWLRRLGAEVVGLSRGRARPPVPPPAGVIERAGDITDAGRTAAVMAELPPRLVLHLAGETLVSRGFAAPAETFRANVLGSVSVLEAAMRCPETDAVVLLGSPATDPTATGPAGPYAASKQAVEAVAAGYAHPLTQRPLRRRPLRIAVVRPGVMVGGDWARARLVPDLARAVRDGQPVALRSPDAARPWQHVLDGLSGVLTVGRQLLHGGLPRLVYDLGRPDHPPVEAARELVTALLAGLGVPDWPVEAGAGGGADRLRLGCATATAELGWRPTWDLAETAAATAAWYRRALDEPASLGDLTDEQTVSFVECARARRLPWSLGQVAS